MANYIRVQLFVSLLTFGFGGLIQLTGRIMKLREVAILSYFERSGVRFIRRSCVFSGIKVEIKASSCVF